MTKYYSESGKKESRRKVWQSLRQTKRTIAISSLIYFEGIAILLLPFGLQGKFVIFFAAAPSFVQGAPVSKKKASSLRFCRFLFIHPLPIILRAGATHCDYGIRCSSICSYFTMIFYCIPCIVQAYSNTQGSICLSMVLYHHYVPWYSLLWVLAARFRHTSSSGLIRLAWPSYASFRASVPEGLASFG